MSKIKLDLLVTARNEFRIMDDRMSPWNEIAAALARWLGPDGRRFFLECRARYGGVAPVMSEMEAEDIYAGTPVDPNPITRVEHYRSQKPFLPHPVHLREGMQVRNFLRGLPGCKDWSDHELDNRWAKLVEMALDISQEKANNAEQDEGPCVEQCSDDHDKCSPSWVGWDDRQRYITKMAMEFFEEQLWSDSGDWGHAALMAFGLNEEQIREQHIGFAPDSWSALIDHMRKHRVSATELEWLYLAVSKKDARGYYDRFRNRIIVPHFDVHGEVVSFSGFSVYGISNKEDCSPWITSHPALYGIGVKG